MGVFKKVVQQVFIGTINRHLIFLIVWITHDDYSSLIIGFGIDCSPIVTGVSICFAQVSIIAIYSSN
jgi:hypothetical protein